MKHYIRFPRAEGTHSRQAHADLPTGTFEREMSKDGFFGPAAHFHHRHPPTGWARFAGSLNPRAYDLNKLPAAGKSPWDATPFLYNGDTKIRYWRTDQRMDHLVRNQDGDELLSAERQGGDARRVDGELGDADLAVTGRDEAHELPRVLRMGQPYGHLGVGGPEGADEGGDRVDGEGR